METLNEVRALLTRQQAEKLAIEKQLNATPTGTKEWGELRARILQTQGAIIATRQRMNGLIQGSQSSLL